MKHTQKGFILVIRALVGGLLGFFLGILSAWVLPVIYVSNTNKALPPLLDIMWFHIIISAGCFVAVLGALTQIPRANEGAAWRRFRQVAFVVTIIGLLLYDGPGFYRRLFSQSLSEAIQKGDFNGVRTALDQGAYANDVDIFNGWEECGNIISIDAPMPLIVSAVRKGDVRIVELLLERGADPNEGSCNDGSAFRIAIETGHGDIAETLIKHGAFRGADIGTVIPLNTAVESHDLASVRLLTDHGANANQAGDDGLTPLMTAARQGDYEIAKFLLSRKADVTAKTQDGESALTFAAVANHLLIAGLLVRHGMKMGILEAALLNNRVMLETLLRHGRNINQRDAEGDPPIIKAALWGSLASVRLLASHGANVNATDANGNTAIMRVCDREMGDSDETNAMIAALLARLANVRAIDSEGKSVWARLCNRYGTRKAKLLLVLNHNRTLSEPVKTLPPDPNRDHIKFGWPQ